MKKHANAQITYDDRTGVVTHMRLEGDFEWGRDYVTSNPDERECPADIFVNDTIHIIIVYRRMTMQQLQMDTASITGNDILQ